MLNDGLRCLAGVRYRRYNQIGTPYHVAGSKNRGVTGLSGKSFLHADQAVLICLHANGFQPLGRVRTIAKGAIANGAIANGAIAKGAIANGAIVEASKPLGRV